VIDSPRRREAASGHGTTFRSDLGLLFECGFGASASRRGTVQTYDAMVKLALFCANQARTSVMKNVAREAWRLAVEYRDQAANLGEPPNIGKKPPHVDEA